MNQALAKVLFDYSNGRLFWKRTRGSNAMAGDSAGSINNRTGYRSVYILGNMYLCSRLTWIWHNGEIPKGLEMDHINRVRDDDRIENLRLVTRTENQQNMAVAKGYVWVKSKKKWEARIRLPGGKRKYLGRYRTETEAHQAYLKARRNIMELKGIIDNLKIIAAMNYSRVIGINGRIPWHIARDLQRFRELTYGNPVIMGRKTFESIGAPLDGRKNIILTNQYGYHPTGTVICRHIESALLAATFENPDAQIWVIGGSEVYTRFIDHARELHITFVQFPLDEGIMFPDVNLEPYDILVKEEYPMEGKIPAHTYFHFRLPEAA